MSVTEDKCTVMIENIHLVIIAGSLVVSSTLCRDELIIIATMGTKNTEQDLISVSSHVIFNRHN